MKSASYYCQLVGYPTEQINSETEISMYHGGSNWSTGTERIFMIIRNNDEYTSVWINSDKGTDYGDSWWGYETRNCDTFFDFLCDISEDEQRTVGFDSKMMKHMKQLVDMGIDKKDYEIFHQKILLTFAQK